MDSIARWRIFEAKVQERGLGWALHRAPGQLRWARSPAYPRGLRINHLLPDSYLRFVKEIGFPVFGTSYYDRSGFSFLPPEAMEACSLQVFDVDGNELPPEDGGPTEAKLAFFAGYDLSDMEGFAFAPLSDGTLGVWLVEGCMAREELGTFDGWLDATLGELERSFASMDADEVRRLEGENDEDDPHRLVDYALSGYQTEPYSSDDLTLHWVESQSKSPYLYGLINDAGEWLLPMSETFMSVRPFRDGIAEVIFNDTNSSYAGPWIRIRTDGSRA